ncbi:MAG: GrpB family protein [Microbacteriaceae bacterium]|nr:GrpB family protein [Microbacteriaceae bacterium]MCL2794934.1 GrpB family protein [Microbacteriaceae bacterium]
MIELSEYDPAWPAAFERAAAELLTIEPGWVVEHVGSTAIPGMIAKPVIDVAVRMSAADDAERHRAALEALAWRLNPGGPASRVTFVRVDASGARTHLAHFYRPADWDAAHQRVFRDWLREHDEDRELYAAAKRAAAAAAASGRDYTALKTDAVQRIMDRARAARGLPPVDVWEK